MKKEATWVAGLMNAAGQPETPITADELLSGPKTADGKDPTTEALRKRAEKRRQERLKERESKQDARTVSR